MKTYMHKLSVMLPFLVLVSCASENEKSMENSSLSLLDRLDKGKGEINLDIAVMPFTDSNGNVYLVGEDGNIEKLAGITAEFDNEVGSSTVNESMQREFEKTFDVDLHVVGVIGRRDTELVIYTAALDPVTGDVYANHLDSLAVTDEQLEKLSLAEGLPEQALAISIDSIMGIHKKNGIRKQNIKFRVPRLSPGPKGGWGGVFRRALGLGDKGKTRTRPVPWKPWGLDTRPNDGDDPRDTPPPEIFGEEIDTDMVCRVKIQCRWATAKLYYPPVASVISIRNKHCGYFTYIPGAGVERLGTHVQPGVGTGTHGGSLLNGHVEALVFQSDRGFQELSWSYKFLPYDNVRDNSDNKPPVCAMAKCIRENSWKYHLLDARPYTPFGSDKPNSNSFIGAMKKACNVPASNLPTYVRGGGDQEGNYAGLHYWDKVGHRWATSKM